LALPEGKIRFDMRLMNPPEEGGKLMLQVTDSGVWVLAIDLVNFLLLVQLRIAPQNPKTPENYDY